MFFVVLTISLRFWKPTAKHQTCPIPLCRFDKKLKMMAKRSMFAANFHLIFIADNSEHEFIGAMNLSFCTEFQTFNLFLNAFADSFLYYGDFNRIAICILLIFFSVFSPIARHEFFI